MIKDHSIKTNTKGAVPTPVEMLLPSLEALSEADLVELRHQLDLRLSLDLSTLDLAEELALQFRQAKALLNEVQNDKSTPVNQKSQIFNSVRTQLGDIVKQQDVVWNMQRLKKYETAFVKSVHLLNDEARNAFFDLYGEHLKDPTLG